MPKYSVNCTVVGGKHVGVYDAETPEQAIEMAEADAYVSLCHQCSDACGELECEDFTADEIE